MKRIVVYSFIIFAVLILSSCGAPDYTIFEDQGFKFHVSPADCYKNVSTCEKAYIFELLDEHKDAEVVWFPETLGGGIERIVIGTYKSDRTYFYSDNAKRFRCKNIIKYS